MLKSWGIVRFIKPYLYVLVFALLLMGATATLEGLRALLVRPIIDNLLALSTSSTRIELLPTSPFFERKDLSRSDQSLSPSAPRRRHWIDDRGGDFD